MRQPRRLTPSPFNKPGAPFILYPAYHMTTILDTQEQVEQVKSKLIEAGYTPQAIAIFTGENAMRQIDQDGRKHGWIARFLRNIQDYVADETQIIKRYQQACVQGKHVMYIHAGTPMTKARVREILREHGGYETHFFGPYVMEDF
ncbi:hypothetical protein [Deinococcus roseus]|uniref:Uncharacterized protein n=1 Tax=Deinococcus roseus TaxID=392414 RepID=A0ABQ2D3R7_9DEIO|nr:hypothetical protein [Deinococcus roseus]GGJ44828.1 hypothetical protein GCM10008938_33810 [Deinococcus roseus]